MYNKKCKLRYNYKQGCPFACGSYILKLANQQIMSDAHLHLSSYYSITNMIKYNWFIQKKKKKNPFSLNSHSLKNKKAILTNLTKAEQRSKLDQRTRSFTVYFSCKLLNLIFKTRIVNKVKVHYNRITKRPTSWRKQRQEASSLSFICLNSESIWWFNFNKFKNKLN